MDEQKAKNREYEIKIEYLTDSVDELKKELTAALLGIHAKLDRLVDQKESIKNDISALRNQFGVVVANQNTYSTKINEVESEVEALKLDLDRVYTYAKAYGVFIPIGTGITASIITAMILYVIGLK